MAELAATLVLEQRLQQSQHFGAVQLVWRTGIGVGQRNVRRGAGFDCEGDADDLGLHVIERRRFGVERKDVGAAERIEPAVEVRAFEHELVVAARRPASGEGGEGEEGEEGAEGEEGPEALEGPEGAGRGGVERLQQ